MFNVQIIRPSARMVMRQERKRRETVEENKRIGTHSRQSGKAVHVCYGMSLGRQIRIQGRIQ